MILLLLFSISSTIRASNVQKPIQKNTLCACADFFHGRSQWIMPLKIAKKNSWIFWLSQNMKNDVNSQEMLWNKISENPRKGFLQLLARGMNKIKKKKNIFSNPTPLKLSFAPGHGMFHGKICILGFPNVH